METVKRMPVDGDLEGDNPGASLVMRHAPSEDRARLPADLAARETLAAPFLMVRFDFRLARAS